MAQRKRRRKKQSSFVELCQDWGMVCLIVGGLAAWSMLPRDIGEPIGYVLLASAVLLGTAEYFRPKPKRRRR